MEAQQKFIDTIRSVSIQVNEYLDSRMYQADCPDPDAITTSTIYNRVMSMAIQELDELGITLHIDGDIYVSNESAELVMMLRQSFDKNQFNRIINGDKELITRIQSLLEGDEYDPELLICEVIELLHANIPLSDVWNILNKNKDILSCKPGFKAHITALVEFSSDQIANSYNENALITYVTKISEHAARVKFRIEALVSVIESELYEELLKGIDKYAADLMNDVDLDMVASYLEYNDHPAYWGNPTDAPFVAAYKRRHPWHAEYYEVRSSRPFGDNWVRIVCDVYDDKLNTEDNLKRIYKIFPRPLKDDKDLVSLIVRSIASVIK